MSQDAVHIQGLAQPGRGMGENGRRMGKEEDPRMRQQQNPLASPTVSRFFLSASVSRILLRFAAISLFAPRRCARHTAVTLAFTSIQLTAPFVYMQVPSTLARLSDATRRGNLCIDEESI